VGKESVLISHGMKNKKSRRLAPEKHGIKIHTSFRAGSMSDGNNYPKSAKSKGSNGVVAVGLPHRNYSVLKQAAPNKL